MRINDKVKHLIIVTPSEYKTGGVELLHQLAYELKQEQLDAHIAYIHEPRNGVIEEYRKYVIDYALLDDITDSSDTLLIIPERYTWIARRFSYCEKAIWWLSLDNYLKRKSVIFAYKKYGFLSAVKIIVRSLMRKEIQLTDKELKRIRYHFVQSNYVKDFLSMKGIDSCFLSDYINDRYFGSQCDMAGKENIVVYNPKKGARITEYIIKRNRDIQFIPLQNLMGDEVIELLDRAKVYIDFGEFPGKDRIPREAATRLCCIIIGKRGAGSNKFDFPFPEKYKVDSPFHEVNRIREIILKCFDSFEECVSDFEHYREIIQGEKEGFLNEIKDVFLRDKNVWNED